MRQRRSRSSNTLLMSQIWRHAATIGGFHDPLVSSACLHVGVRLVHLRSDVPPWHAASKFKFRYPSVPDFIILCNAGAATPLLRSKSMDVGLIMAVMGLCFEPAGYLIGELFLAEPLLTTRLNSLN
jgi:hypothetical protein